MHIVHTQTDSLGLFLNLPKKETFILRKKFMKVCVCSTGKNNIEMVLFSSSDFKLEAWFLSNWMQYKNVVVVGPCKKVSNCLFGLEFVWLTFFSCKLRCTRLKMQFIFSYNSNRPIDRYYSLSLTKKFWKF